MLDFTALDFETANFYRGSPCAVGLVKVRGVQIVDERHWLIRPPEPVDFFEDFNTGIHGITADAVKDAPRWRDALPHILDFIGDDPVACHNAAFDIGVIRYACAADNIEWPALRFLCTLVLSRKALTLPSYTLPFVTDACGYPLDEHHNALEDARAVVGVVRHLAAQADASDLPALAAAHSTRLGHMDAGVYRGSVAAARSTQLSATDANPDADPDGYLYGRVVVFTGALMSMTRQMAWDEVAKVGGTPKENTTRRTNVLVLGDFNPAGLRPGATFSSKARRAFELQDSGQDIELMTEADFLQVLDGVDLLSFDPDSLSAATTADSPRINPAAGAPTPPPPRPLRREARSTDQTCSVESCQAQAMFPTRSRPTYCDAHITAITHEAGLEPLETFTRTDDWRLTRCLHCGVVAHYRFEYILDKNAEGERTCRACYWRWWADMARSSGHPGADKVVGYDEAQQRAETAHYRYLRPLTDPSRAVDPHHVECARCGRVSAQRLGDIAWKCTCWPKN